MEKKEIKQEIKQKKEVKAEDLQGPEFGDRQKRSKVVLKGRYQEFQKWLEQNAITKILEENEHFFQTPIKILEENG